MRGQKKSMSAKEYAEWLNHQCGLPFDEACNMAGYSPREEYREAFHVFLMAMASIAAVFLVLWLVPLAVAAEQPQLTESAMLSCLNNRGMVINGELWTCSPTGMRP